MEYSKTSWWSMTDWSGMSDPSMAAVQLAWENSAGNFRPFEKRMERDVGLESSNMMVGSHQQDPFGRGPAFRHDDIAVPMGVVRI